MTITGDRLYALLPAYMREVDTEAGGALRALLEVMATQFDTIDRDIEQLGEGFFVETASDWIVPYIGDLLRVQALRPVSELATQRAHVANTLAYRRRKGTAAVLEQLARDLTGWPAHVVEFFDILANNQHMNHLRLHRPGTASIRAAGGLELIESAFDETTHTVDVRRIEPGRGRHNLPSIGLFVWPLEPQWVSRGTATPAANPPDGRFRVDPLGRDVRMFGRRRPESDIAALSEERHVGAPLRRRPLREELDALRDAITAGTNPQPVFFDEQPPVRVFVQDTAITAPLEVDAEHLMVCHLEDLGGPPGWLRPPAGRVAFDPITGRVALPAGDDPFRVLVDHAYGSPGSIGAGPYDRRTEVDALLEERAVTWHIGVTRGETPVPGVLFETIGEAVDEWNAQPAGTVGLISIMDSHRWDEDLTGANRIEVPEGSRLIIAAARWPLLTPPGARGPVRVLGVIEAVEVRPTLVGPVEITGTAPDDSEAPGEIVIDGLLIGGSVTVSSDAGSDLGLLELVHCTVVPGLGGVTVDPGNEHLDVVIRTSIVGPVAFAVETPRLTATDSIIHDPAGIALGAVGAEVELEGVTMLGTTVARAMYASNSIFQDTLTIERRQLGCVRFSYVAPGSTTPRRYRCQPDLALAAGGASVAEIEARMRPNFATVDPSRAAYGKLAVRCPAGISAGSEDGSEMGAFAFQQNPLRLANFRDALDEYLRFGLEAGVIQVIDQ